MSKDDKSSERGTSPNDENEGGTPWYTRPPWKTLLALLGLFVLLVVGAAILRAMVVPTAFPALIDSIAWPVFWLITVMVMLVTFEPEIRAFLKEMSSIETPWLKLFRAAKEAAPGKDIPLPPPSAKQQILNEWQKVHDRLAGLYEEKVGKTPPARYRPLVTRLKNQGHLKANTGKLLDEVRSIRNRVRRQPDWSVSPQLGDYYAIIVSVLLELLDNREAPGE